MNRSMSFCLVGIAATSSLAIAFGGPECEAAAKAEEKGNQMFSQAKGSPVQVGPMAGKPVVADVNKDGILDIIVACGACCGQKPSALSGHVAILLGDGKGGFAHALSPIKVAPTALKVAVADFNNDKNLDIACIEHDSYDVHLLLGDGKGGFQKAPGSPFASRKGNRPHTHDIVAADINEDGVPDIAVTNANDNTIGILLGDKKGGFYQIAPVAAGTHPYEGLTLVDVNGDHHLDIAITNLKGNAVSVLIGNGKGEFVMASDSPVSLGERPGCLAVGDLNNDGRPDIVATHDDVGLADILLSTGSGSYLPTKTSPTKLPQPVWGLTIADIDRDGNSDVVFAGLRGNIVAMRGDGKGSFGPERIELKTGEETTYVLAADLNKDGKLDLVASNYKSGDISVFLAK